MRTGFDNDGVLHDFGNGVREYLDSIGRTYGWKDNAAEPHEWNFFEYWHMTPEEFVQICHDGVDAGYIFNKGVRPGAVEAVNAIHDMGHTTVMVTDRFFGSTPEVSHERTYKWIEKNGFKFDEVHFTADKTSVPTDVFVEDKLENYDTLVQAGTPCYLINRPWNQVKGGDSRYRINDISEYPALVRAMDLLKV